MQLPPAFLTASALLLLHFSSPSAAAPAAAATACPLPTTVTGAMSVHTNSPTKSGCLNAAGQWDQSSTTCAKFTGVGYYPYNPYPEWGCGTMIWNFTSPKGMCGLPQDSSSHYVIRCAPGMETTSWYWTLQGGNGINEGGGNWLMPNFYTYGPNYHPLPGVSMANKKVPLDLMVATDSRGESGQVGPVYQIAFEGWS